MRIYRLTEEDCEKIKEFASLYQSGDKRVATYWNEPLNEDSFEAFSYVAEHHFFTWYNVKPGDIYMKDDDKED